MELPSLKDFSPKELLQITGKILDELSAREIVRTSNNPVSGYTEWLVSKRLGLTLCGNSEKGFDSTDKSGVKYEIKARRVTPANKSRQLSAIRDIQGEHFNFLIAVVYDKDFEVILALKIPRSVVVAKSTYVKSTNSYKLMAEDGLKDEPGVEDIAHLLR
jgi:hypothetical protein